MIFMGMTTIIIIDIFLVRLLTKIVNASLTPGGPAQPKRSKVPANPMVSQLPPPSVAHLQGVPSVTENTTRFFEQYQAPAEGEKPTTTEKLER
jgi:hypothetical protein